MPITPGNLVQHELIGLRAEVVKSKNRSQAGAKGTVTDETRQTLVIDTANGERSFVKDQCMFKFTLPTGEKVSVDGSLLVARPEDRIKKKVRKW